MIGKTLSHYRVTAALGAGGMGEVYRARHVKLGREAAIKVLPSELASDPDRRRWLGKRARERFDAEYEGGIWIRRLRALYDEVLAGP